MSEEQLKGFLEAVKADAGLQEKLKAAADADAVVAIAKAAGFVISAEELNRAQAEVSEEELEGVAGGFEGGYDMNAQLQQHGIQPFGAAGQRIPGQELHGLAGLG
jgi:predicted ribosomally synthesized peptide with nif11-like leader